MKEINVYDLYIFMQTKIKTLGDFKIFYNDDPLTKLSNCNIENKSNRTIIAILDYEKSISTEVNISVHKTGYRSFDNDGVFNLLIDFCKYIPRRIEQPFIKNIGGEGDYIQDYGIDLFNIIHSEKNKKSTLRFSLKKNTPLETIEDIILQLFKM